VAWFCQPSFTASSLLPPQHSASHVPVFDAVKALAFVGDLSMDQPVDHSARTARPPARVADALAGLYGECSDFADLMGDGVGCRNAMLSDCCPKSTARCPATLRARLA
jgi:hypothetical protein